jgi:hypothetical protein
MARVAAAPAGLAAPPQTAAAAADQAVKTARPTIM